MESIAVRCLLCAKICNVSEEHKDYKKIVQQNKELPTFICDLCDYRIRHESEEKDKQRKPM